MFLTYKNYQEKFEKIKAQKEANLLNRSPSKEFVIDKRRYSKKMQFLKDREIEMKRLRDE